MKTIVMFLVMINIAVNVMSQTTQRPRTLNLLDHNGVYADPFLPSDANSGKKYYSTTTITCWARGGVCVHIRDCRSLSFDPQVAGCSSNFKVCCRNFNRQTPQIGHHRRGLLEEFSALDDADIETMADRNLRMLALLMN